MIHPLNNQQSSNQPSSQKPHSQPLLNHRYHILRALAEGSFGKTYLAVDEQMPSRRRCVIKQLKPISGSPAIAKIVQDRFLREVAVLDAIGKGHPQIPTLYAYFSQAGQFYLVQEWIEGEPLFSMPQSPWTSEQVRELLNKVLPALAYVHSQNIIHRDIKPGNIVVRKVDQLPFLIDFGSVKELMSTVMTTSGPNKGATKSSIVIGTPGFMSPEQAVGRPTFSSDLYSLGLTAVYLLTGRSPGEIPTHSHTRELLWQQYAPTVDSHMATVLSNAISPEGQARYVMAIDMLSALEQALRSPASANPFPETIAPVQQPLATVLQTTATQTTAIQNESLENSSPSAEAESSKIKPKFQQVARASAAVLLVAAVVLGYRTIVQNGRNPQVVRSKTELETVGDEAIETSNNISMLTAQLEESPDDAATQQQLATAYQQQAANLYQRNREADAMESVEAALSIQPNFVPALILKGDIVANQTIQDTAGAIALYTQALGTEPNNTTALTKRCSAYIKQKKWTLAEADCTQALSLEPGSVELHSKRGDIYFALERYEEAIDDYSEAIALNARNNQEANSQRLYYRRHEALGELGRYEEALADLEKMRSLEP